MFFMKNKTEKFLQILKKVMNIFTEIVLNCKVVYPVFTLQDDVKIIKLGIGGCCSKNVLNIYLQNV